MRQLVMMILLFSFSQSEILNSKQLFNKTTTKVKEQKISNKKIFYATTTYDETKVNDVVLRFSGFLRNLNANSTHKYIKKGDLLFEVYSKELVTSFDELLIAYRYKNNKTQRKAIKDRLELLGVTKKIINQVIKTKKVPYYIPIYSKYDGVIINKKVNEESYVKSGQTLFSLANLKNIWVDANIYQKDLSFIHKDMDTKVSIDGVGSFNSKIDLIHPIVDNKTKTISIRLILKNQDMKIYPNMFAKVQFIQKAKTILTLSTNAVITKGNKHYVFKPLSNDQFEPVEIQAIRLSSKIYQINSGLQKDDIVINNTLFMLDSDAITNGLYDTDDDDW